jgi:hypothetical protein
VHHPVLRAIHLHKQQQNEANGHILDGIAVNADSNLQLAKPSVTIAYVVLRAQTHNVEENLMSNNAPNTAYSALTIQKLPFTLADGSD